MNIEINVCTSFKLIVFKESEDFFMSYKAFNCNQKILYCISFLKISYYFLGLANDFSTNSANSMVCSTPKIKDTCLQSPSREVSQKEKLVQV